MGFLFKMIGFCCGILVILFSYAEGTEPVCERCGCCINKECSTQYVDGRYIDEYCTLGCIAGYGGTKCYNKCANDCVTCNQEFAQNCATCDERKYVNDDKRCVDCPENCKKCTSGTQCQECYFPYSNDVSTQDCSLTCPRNCLCETLGVCSSCQDGFYNVSNTCRNACPVYCKTCTNQSHCQSCKPSYTGDKCCVKNGHCLKCSSSTECETCLDGYYGDQCGKICPTKCKGSLCDRGNGNCISCQDGYHGTKCGKTCPKTCHRLQCDLNTGTCLSCDVGFYGDDCTQNCSKTCLNNRCKGQNGNCSDGCIVGFAGPNCLEVSIDREDGTDTEIGTVIGISATILVVIVTIVTIVTIIIVRRWKRNLLRKYQATNNEVSYVNTQLQTTSINAIDTSVNNDQRSIYANKTFDQSEYERLDERHKQRDEYDQIKSVK